MRLLLLFVLFWLGITAATAQTTPLALPPDSVARPPAPAFDPDTAAAIHRLFVARRQVRAPVLLGTGVVFLLGAALGSVFGQERYGSYGGDEVRIFNLAVWAVPTLGVELIVLGRYSRRNERFALADLRAHRLSRSVKANLAPKYFQLAPAR